MEPGVRSPRRELCWPQGLAKHRRKPGGETSSSSCMPKHSREGQMAGEGLGPESDVCDQTLPTNHPLHFTPSGHGVGWVGVVQGLNSLV